MSLKGRGGFLVCTIFPSIRMVCIYSCNFVNISEKNRTFSGKIGINRSQKKIGEKRNLTPCQFVRF